MKMKNDIVQNIKDCGQSLIDNAEKIAGSLPKYATDLSLSCYPTEEDRPIYINVSYDFVPEKFVDRCHSGDNMENH